MSGAGSTLTATASATGWRGGPLAALALVLSGWVLARSLLWESPFVLPDIPLPLPQLVAEVEGEPPSMAGEPFAPVPALTLVNAGGGPLPPLTRADWPMRDGYLYSARRASAHQRLMTQAFAIDWHSAGVNGQFGRQAAVQASPNGSPSGAAPPFAFPPADQAAVSQTQSRPDRWSLDAFAFIRQGSGSLSTSQGRVPVYGASQVAANLQYRIAPRSGFDPRGFVRAYRALVDGGETEAAAGLSARPIPPVPLRLNAEMRVSQNPVGTDYRPAAYVVSELPSQRLPLDVILETYAAAGYVGGEADTYFADGQLALTREFITIDNPAGDPIRLSIGGGSWAGMQRGVERVDVGPTMRFDLTVGEVPARISVDWRERVAGEAEPSSGVAATVSTRF